MHASHHKECRALRSAAGGDTFMDGVRPLHKDHPDQEAQAQQEGDQGIVQEALAVAVVHHRLTAVHEKGRDQQKNRHTQSEHLIQMWTGQSQEVDAHDHQAGEHERVRDQEEPQAETVGSRFVLV